MSSSAGPISVPRALSITFRGKNRGSLAGAAHAAGTHARALRQILAKVRSRMRRKPRKDCTSLS